MENDLSYEDIRFFRSVARAQARKDAATKRKLEAERLQNQPQKPTWGEWLWGTTSQSNAEGGMSEEERKQINDIIDYDATAAEETVQSTPRDFMRTRISATLNKGSFSLRTDPHGKNSDIIALVFDSFSADALQLTDSVSGKLALGGFRVYDGTVPGSLYPQIVRVKDVDSNGKSTSRQRSLDVGGTEKAFSEIEEGTKGTSDPFFVMELEHNPLDGRADDALTVKMRHLIVSHAAYESDK
jgi:vacuolar protein sorting-associated protein 13A/C